MRNADPGRDEGGPPTEPPELEDALITTPITDETFRRRQHALAQLSHLLAPSPDHPDKDAHDPQRQ